MKRNVVRILGVGALTLALIGCSDNENGTSDTNSTQVQKYNDSDIVQGIEDIVKESNGDNTFIQDIILTDGNALVTFYGTADEWNIAESAENYATEAEYDTGIRPQLITRVAVQSFMSFSDLNSITFHLPNYRNDPDSISETYFNRDEVNEYLGKVIEGFKLEDLTPENYVEMYHRTVDQHNDVFSKFYNQFTTNEDDKYRIHPNNKPF